MSIESDEDLAGLQAAGSVVARALAAMRRCVAPGVTTAELDAVAARVLRRRGARSAPQLAYGFPGASCISVNDEAVHGVPGPRRLRPGDVVTLDVTADLDGYVADAAVTLPVPPARRRALDLCACAQEALRAGLIAARAGSRTSDVGAAVERSVERRGFRVLRELCGHGVGRAVHEPPPVPNFAASWLDSPLSDGLVVAIEPIVAESTRRTRATADGWTLRTHDGSFAAHFEHTVVVCSGAPLVVTAP